MQQHTQNNGKAPTLTETQALQWLGDLFETPPEQLLPSTPRQDIEGWDSLGTLSLMADLDEDYGIILTEDQLTGLVTFGDLLTLLHTEGVIKT